MHATAYKATPCPNGFLARTSTYGQIPRLSAGSAGLVQAKKHHLHQAFTVGEQSQNVGM